MTVDDRLLSGASSLNPNKSSGDIVERCESVAVLVAPLGSASGDGRWVAAQTLREASAEIDGLRLEHDCACREIGAAIAERDEWKAHTTESAAEIERLRRESETADKFKAGLRELLGTPPDGTIIYSLMELATKLRVAESAVAAAWEEAADWLAAQYPDNVNTNAFCAALRSHVRSAP